MRRFIISGVFLGLAMAFVVALGGRSGAGDEPKKEKAAVPGYHAIDMLGTNKFDPEELEIKVGDSVVWVNRSGAEHTAIPNKDSEVSFDKQVVAKQKFSAKVKFEKAGTATYFCENHPAGMKGKIVVKP